MMGQRSVYNACRPEVHDVLRRWRKVADGYDPPRVLIGETYVLEPEAFARVLRRRRRAESRVQLHAVALEVPAARSRGGRARRAAAARRTRGRVDGRQPRQSPLPDPLGERRSASDPRRAGDAASGCAARRSSTTATRSVCPTPTSRRSDARSGRRDPRRAHGPRRRAHADAVDRRSRAPASPSPASSRGSRTATSRAYNVADQRHDPDSDALVDARSHRSAATRCPSSREGSYRDVARPERRRVGVARASERSWRAIFRRCGRGGRCRPRHDPHIDDTHP